jgi:hypothetical protein
LGFHLAHDLMFAVWPHCQHGVPKFSRKAAFHCGQKTAQRSFIIHFSINWPDLSGEVNSPISISVKWGECWSEGSEDSDVLIMGCQYSPF